MMQKKGLSSLFRPVELTQGECWKTILTFSFPIIVSYLLQQVYTISDAAIVGQTLTAQEVAGVNDTSSLIFIFLQFAFGVSAGFCVITSCNVGAHNPAGVRRSLTTQIVLSGVLTVVLTALALVLLDPMLAWINVTPDSPEVYRAAYTYCAIIFAGIGAQLFYNFICSFLRSMGDSVTPLAFLLFSTLLNVGLDLLFIVVFRWGVAGAALATGISQCIGGLLPLILFLGKNDSLLHLVPTRLEWRPFFLSCTNGMSELMGNISSSIVSMLYNFQLLNYAGENGIAAYGVLMYVQFIFIAVFFGYTIGVGPVIGYHYGAGNHAELKNLLRKSLKLNIITGISMTILANLFAGALSRIFVGYDPELYAMTKSAFHIFALSFLVCGINIFASAFFTALNNGLVSAVISFLRTLVFQVGSVLILPAFLGLTGIWLSNTFADLMAMLISIIFLTAMRKRYHYA